MLVGAGLIGESAMDILSIVLIVFGILELSNVLMLYLTPETRRGNGMGVFKAYEKSKCMKQN